MENNFHTIVILNDGETFSSVEGCQLVTLSERALEALENGEKLSNLLSDSRASEDVASIVELG